MIASRPGKMGDRKFTVLIVVAFAVFPFFGECNAAIVPVDVTYSNVPLGNDFSIPWTFDYEADTSTVDWTYKSSLSATPTTVMSKVGTSAAMIFNNYNVEHAGNGNITLKSVTVNNTGIFFCTVTYKIASGHPAVTGTATVSVFEGDNDGGNGDGLSDGEKGGIGGSVGVVGVGAIAGCGYLIFVVFSLGGITSVKLYYDQNGSYGFSHGSIIVTEVTPSGPASKLKVKDHIRKIDSSSTEGKSLDQVLQLLKGKLSFTLTVSKVGSNDTRDVVVTCKHGEPIGFKADACTMVQRVQEGGPAHKKLKVGNRILSINGKSTEGMPSSEVNNWLKPNSRSIELSIQKDGQHKRDVELRYNDLASIGIEIDDRPIRQVSTHVFAPTDKAASVGIEMGNRQSQKGNTHVYVSAVNRGSPAEGEIAIGDNICAVNGRSTEGMKIESVREMMKAFLELKITNDVTLLELDCDAQGSVGVETAPANIVTSVTHGGQSGIHEGNQIIEINGASTEGKNHKQIHDMLTAARPNLTMRIDEGKTVEIRNVTGSVGIETSLGPNFIYKLRKNGSAEQSGKVQPGDKIAKLNGKGTNGMSYEEIHRMLHSAKESVTLALEKGKQPKSSEGQNRQKTNKIDDELRNQLHKPPSALPKPSLIPAIQSKDARPVEFEADHSKKTTALSPIEYVKDETEDKVKKKSRKKKNTKKSMKKSDSDENGD